MDGFSRRGLLKATATAGVGAIVLPGMAAAEEPAATAKLTGRIVRPGDPGYPRASLGWDELFVHYPLVIVFAQETRDVVNALTWARQNNVALRVRSGRHSLEGWSNVDNGIVIDVSELKSVHIDTASRIATVGSGLNQEEAVTTLAKKDLAVTTGTEGSVGLSGATLGGGFGFLTRYLGMACDSLIAAEVVVASGARCAQVIKADLTNNPDLLWALRGAGNGNFGIVTSLTYKTAPLKKVAYLQATWDGLRHLPPIFDTYQRTMPVAGGGIGTQLEIHKNRDPVLRGSPGRVEGTGEGDARPDPVDRQARCHGGGRQLGRHLRRIPDSDQGRARELEVLLAVRDRTVPERERSA